MTIKCAFNKQTEVADATMPSLLRRATTVLSTRLSNNTTRRVSFITSRRASNQSPRNKWDEDKVAEKLAFITQEIVFWGLVFGIVLRDDVIYAEFIRPFATLEDMKK